MYEQYYELESRPFQMTPDPDFYFESLTHRKALSYLGYGLAQGEGFIAITGDIGAGKTTLVGHLMATVDRERLTVASIVTTTLNSDDIIPVVCENFGIDVATDDKSTMLTKFEDFLHEEAREGRRCLLIVDETQNLPFEALEELRMLSNFQLGGQALLQIFLLGQPQFQEALQTSKHLEQLRQRVIAQHHLEPMGEDEVEPYIVHRLKRSGWNGRPKMVADVIPLVYRATQGVPRKVNALMSRMLLEGAMESVEIIDPDLFYAVTDDLHNERDDAITAAREGLERLNGGGVDTTVRAEGSDMPTSAEPQFGDVQNAMSESSKQADPGPVEYDRSNPIGYNIADPVDYDPEKGEDRMRLSDKDGAYDGMQIEEFAASLDGSIAEGPPSSWQLDKHHEAQETHKAPSMRDFSGGQDDDQGNRQDDNRIYGHRADDMPAHNRRADDIPAGYAGDNMPTEYRDDDNIDNYTQEHDRKYSKQQYDAAAISYEAADAPDYEDYENVSRPSFDDIPGDPGDPGDEIAKEMAPEHIDVHQDTDEVDMIVKAHSFDKKDESDAVKIDALLQRVGELESALYSQEESLSKVLTVLVDWVEQNKQDRRQNVA